MKTLGDILSPAPVSTLECILESSGIHPRSGNVTHDTIHLSLLRGEWSKGIDAGQQSDPSKQGAKGRII